MARGVIASALVVLLVACGDDATSPVAPTATAYEVVNPIGSAKRPERRYYVHNTNGQCTVYWIAPNARSVRRKIKCPRELQTSERLRLSGRVCFRESDAAERRGPVRCPPDVLRPERDDRLDAGEYVLPAQSSSAAAP